MTVHIVRRAFRIETLDDLVQAQKERISAERAAGRPARLYWWMRSTPARQAEVLDGGSIYWVIKGYIRARQRILEIETRMDSEGRKRCFLHLEAPVQRVAGFDTIMPYYKLETEYLPDADRIEKAINEIRAY